jgi:hypothetical protein
MLLEDKNSAEPEELFPAVHRAQTDNNYDEKSTTEALTENIPDFEIVGLPINELPDNKVDTANENKSESISPINFEFEMNEENSDRVMSFDDLISKYNIEFNDSLEEVPSESAEQVVLESPMDSKEDVIYNEPAEAEKENSPEYSTENGDEIIETPVSASDTDQLESQVEIVSEFIYKDEVELTESDHDLEAFDRPFESDLLTIETLPFESGLEQKSVSPIETGHIEKASEDYTQFAENSISITNSNENDYEAFDGINEITSDNTALPYSEPQKPLTNFDAKNSESILFTPYHMVDYFASQGIKLVLEDQPADNFGKQLKSFTDWLKVMKKIPASPLIEKTDEKETERIRHFAAHSLEDRDILTESMAEVLAKQGMYENAIALYQKLSLIYPPKSAYFASRIEQLKAAIP